MAKKSYWQEYFENVSPSWMENWYEDLSDLTIPSSYFKIKNEEVNELLNLFDGTSDIVLLKSFLNKIEHIIKDDKNEFHADKMFVRLGSRSPKDHFKFEDGVKESKDVLTLFSDSARIGEDLTLCKNIKYEPYLFLRRWIDMPRSKEFRCFVKNKELRGITQYYYRERYYYLDADGHRSDIRFQAEKLLREIKKKFKLDNFIFDMVYTPTENLPLLIEINPYSSWTDPCLFDWAIDKFEKFEFKWLQSL